jgi:hypothetical protein
LAQWLADNSGAESCSFLTTVAHKDHTGLFGLRFLQPRMSSFGTQQSGFIHDPIAGFGSSLGQGFSQVF